MTEMEEFEAFLRNTLHAKKTGGVMLSNPDGWVLNDDNRAVVKAYRSALIRLGADIIDEANDRLRVLDEHEACTLDNLCPALFELSSVYAHEDGYKPSWPHRSDAPQS
jgi:hypothetical protein